MRILHLNALYPPYGYGGAERSVARLAEAQVRAGHEVAVVCIVPGDYAEEEQNGVRVFRVPHSSLYWYEDWAQHGSLAFHWRKIAMPFNRGQRAHFERILDRVKPDIVNSHSLVDVSTGAWPAAKARGVPIVHTLRDYDLICIDGAAYHDGKPCGARCRAVSFAKRRQHRLIDAVAANSAETLRLHTDRGLFAHVPEHLRRVIWSISGLAETTAAPVRAPREGPFTIGYFGRITEEKGVGTLIEALRMLVAQGVDLRLRIGGKLSDLTDHFVKQAEGLPVDWLGFVDGPSFFAGIDTVVIPSIWPEPLPRTALEAYAAGVPVLASTAGGTPDLVGADNTDWLFAPGDAADLAAKLAPIIAASRAGLPSTEGFVHVLNETTEAVVLDRYMRLYQDTLAARGRPAKAA